jgi:hypothetical protein
VQLVTEPWRFCRDCAAQTGRCAAHSTWFEVIPAILIPAGTVIPTETITVPTGDDHDPDGNACSHPLHP